MLEVDVVFEDDVMIFYMFGLIGYFKGVVSCYCNILYVLFFWEFDGQVILFECGEEVFEFEIQLVMLFVVFFFYVIGLYVVFFSCYCNQCKMVLMYKWNLEEVVEFIECEQIMLFVVLVVMIGDFVCMVECIKVDFSMLFQVGGGGVLCVFEQVGQIDEFFINVLLGIGWGMLEMNVIGIGIGGEDYLYCLVSLGCCFVVFDLCIVD